MPSAPHDPPLTLLATDTVRRRLLPSMTMVIDQGPGGRRRGAVAMRVTGGGLRRAEHGPGAPLLLEARPHAGGVDLQVWGRADTASEAVASAVAATRRWVGLDDDLTGFAELASAHPVLRGVLRHLPPPVIGGLPRLAESFGRAVLAQLVQGVEARRSTLQLLVGMLGRDTGQGLWAWPTREALGGAPAHLLRRCGIPLRSAAALHAVAVDEPRLQRLAAERQWHALDEALTRLPGVGGWTSGETRLYLGDADAVSVGDYHIPAQVGWAIGERSEDDATMLELLAPFAGHRGRVIKLIERAGVLGLVDSRPRRAPRAALSAHRYW